ncbi:LytR C-terminal domain-containing protein, partial [Streptomyces sp. NPDC058964]|uniref:LytR C-terminal domain-containing protein n=1 Tax=Streptomyces sp. NPDC058964 TaxID=3346681 RepID=UPI00367D6A44
GVPRGGGLGMSPPTQPVFTRVPLGRMKYVVPGVGSTLKWDEAGADKLFQSLRDDKPLAVNRPPRGPAAVPVGVAPQQIRVQVENGTSTAGLARRLDTALAATGFATTHHPVTSAEQSVRRTVIVYDPHWDRSARSLAAALPGSELRARPGQGAVLKVIAGADSNDVRKVKAQDPAQGTSGVVRGDEVVCP